MVDKIYWGVIGCGGIANKFAESLAVLPQGELYAGASRSPGKAEAYIEQHGAKVAYTDYASLVADEQVDAVYVATTHNFHFENVKLCLEHGKHVLCEKPMTISRRQAQQLVDLAAEKSLFMMEAMWTRYIPAIIKLKEMLDEGVIGDVLSVRADFCIGGVDFPKEGRLWNKALAGGSILDLGIYPITFADIIMGGDFPESIKGDAFIGETDVDDRSYYQFSYSGGRFAQLSSSFTHAAPVFGVVMGSRGYITVPSFFHASGFEICRSGEEPEQVDLPYADAEGFKFEIDDVMQCIAAGKLQSDVHPLTKTLEIMEIMDTLRGQWKLKYPNE